MGTRGLISYYYKGRYYTFWNSYDSYPNGFGRELASKIPKDSKKYKAWLANTRAKFAKLEKHLEQNYWAVPRLVQYASYDIKEIKQDKEAKRVLANYNIMGRVLELQHYRPTFFPPVLTLFVEWTYVIDLEVSELRVAGHRAYRALDLRNLSEESFKDETYHQDDDDDFPSDLHVEIWGLPQEEDDKYSIPESDSVRHTLDQLSDRIAKYFIRVEPNFTVMSAPATHHLAPGLVCAAEIASCIYQQWLPSSRIRPSNIARLSKTNFDDPSYRELCFMVLGMALPHVSLVDSRCFDRRHKLPQVLNYDASDCFGRLQQRFATYLESEGLEAFLCPTMSVFQLGGLMVFICPNIDDASVLRKGVEYIAHQAKRNDHDSYRAVLLSLDHVAFVKCTSGQVKHSETFQLWSETQGSCNGLPVGSKRAVGVFKSLIAFFEEAEIDRLGRDNRSMQMMQDRSAARSSPRLPTELWNKILPMTSPEARRACLEVSREVRLCVQEYCYVLDQEPIRTIDFEDRRSYPVMSLKCDFEVALPYELRESFS